MGPVQIVWFKRDLRVVDHQPLLRASVRGPVLPLAVVEPELWQQADASERQWAFCAESLEELRRALAELGQPLVVRVGAVEQVLERARRSFGVAGLWSHEETGNGWTYARDRRVAAWARRHGIPWVEIPQSGVVRRLASRDGWARRWEERMAESVAPPPQALEPLPDLDPGVLPTAAALGLAPDPCPERQPGPAGRAGPAGELPGGARSPLPPRTLQPAHRLPQLLAAFSPPGLGHPFAAGGGAGQPPSPAAGAAGLRGAAALALPLHPEAGGSAESGVP
jgi:deoxyribodipyrimidine photo-lyase